MRGKLIMFMGLATSFGWVGAARGDVAYHFMPGIEGQTVGFAQFAEVAPQYGPKDFKVRLSGAMVGSDPTNDPTSAQVYLDKWGLGVLNPKAAKGDKGIQGQIQLDGKNGGEYIRLEFPTAVRLTLLTFAAVSKYEDVVLLADGVAVDIHSLFPGTKTLTQISAAQKVWPGTIDFTKSALDVHAKRWEVIVYGGMAGDGIQLENVNVALPEPSSIVLTSFGLAALGMWGWRHRRRRPLPVA